MATYTVASGGGNINSASTYVGGVGIPGSLDTINFTTASGQLTVNATTTILDIDFSNYKNQIVFNNILNVSRNITFGDAGGNATYTVLTNTGGKFIKTGTGTIISNGKTWTGNFELGGAGAYTLTLNDDLNISGELIYTNNSTVTINSANVLNLLGNFTFSLAGTLAGTATIRLTGGNNQTWSAGSITNNVRIDKSGGTLSITGFLLYNTGTLTYVAGTVNTAGSTLRIFTATFDTKGSSTAGATTTSSTGINWDTVTCTNNSTMTISSNFTVVGTFTVNNAVALTVSRSASSGDLYLNSNLAMGTSTNASITSSAATIIMNGTGNWSGGGVVAAPLTFDTSGTITVTGVSGTGVVQFNTRTLTYLNGIVVTAGSTLTLVGSCTLATSDITWNNITNTVTSTITLTSDLIWTNLWSVTAGTLSYAGAGALAPLSSANISFSGSSVVNLKNNIQITNATYTTTTVNTNTINISGNLLLSGSCAGTTNMIINGTGSQTWSHGSAVYLSNNLTINKASGTLTLGLTVYYQSGILTHISGDVDTTTNNSTLNLITVSTLNTNGIIWNNVSATSGTHSIASNFYCNNFSSSNSAINFNNTGGDIYLYKSLTQGVAQLQGTATIYFVGGVTWNQTSLTANHHVKNNIVIDTSETVTFGSYVAYSTGTLTYKRGKVNTKGCTFSIQTATTTLINCNKINFDRVVIDAGLTVIMNEFFNGSPELQTAVSSTTTTNAIITFTDNFEKIAKFVNTNGITFTRPQQLLLLTNQPKKSRNRGIRYINSLPNGIAKNDASVSNNLTVGQTSSILIGDPSMIKY
jgi:hypothetical protein